jgi:HAD superfamily hydrolase (TIGR01450 family)
VLYVGHDAVPHAAESLEVAGRAGMRREYVTNNALRPPQDVVALLRSVGVPAEVEQVVTSAQAIAHLIAEKVPAGSKVLVGGGEGLRAAVREVGMEPVTSAEDAPAAVVLGFDPTVDYARLAEVSLAVRRGALFFAANRDATYPGPRGAMPGNGAIAAFVVTATGVEPFVAGKPEPALHAESIRRSGARNPLVVGDRLDTDIEGAQRAGTPSMLVFTGITDLLTAARAVPPWRPDLIAFDLRGINEPHAASDAGHCGAARASYDAAPKSVRLERGDPTSIDACRAVVTAAWAAIDAHQPVDAIGGLRSV